MIFVEMQQKMTSIFYGRKKGISFPLFFVKRADFFGK